MFSLRAGTGIHNQLTGGVKQKYPLRNRCIRHRGDAIGDANPNQVVNRAPNSFGTPAQRTNKIPQQSPMAVKRQSSKVCNRVYTKGLENTANWDEVFCTVCKSKSLPSPVSSSMVDSNTPSAVAAIISEGEVAAAAGRQTATKIIEVPCNATASPPKNTSSSTTTTRSNSSNNANGRRNKDNDDNNNLRRRSRSQQQRITEAEPEPKAGAPASAREFMTIERLRLGDQINFLLFDPYRTLKFLITELKSRLRTVVPDDINVQKILVEIQQTMKRIRIPNATEPLLMPPPPPRTTMVTTTTGAAPPPPPSTATAARAAATGVECILPKERCHVIKEDPLINHAGKVNSSCQTIVPQLVKACQMCEHQIKQSAPGCNQKEMNINTSNAEDLLMMMDVTGSDQFSEDHRKDMERYYTYKSLQDAIENLKIKSNPFSDDTRKIITQLETELSNFQRELQSASSLSLLHRPHGIKSTTENLKVHCKRLLNEEKEKPEQEEEETFPDFIAKLASTHLEQSKKLDSATQATATTISKESQTNLKNPTQMLCHFEKEKLLLLQKFRASEMKNIQGDLNELHVFIKDQLDGIYHSIRGGHQHLKYHSTNDRTYKSKTNRQKIHRTLQRTEKTSATGLPSPSSSSSPSVAALTSSVLSSTEMQGGKVGVTSPGSSISPGHTKKSSPNLIASDNANANITQSMMKQKQKSSSSSLSAANANEIHNISDAHKTTTRKTFGEKKPNNCQRDDHCDQCYNQHHLFTHVNCCAAFITETPFGNREKMHSSAVECDGCFPHTEKDDKVQRVMTADAVRTFTHSDIKSRKKMTCHQHCQQCHQQPTTTSAAAQEQTQLISSSLPAAAAAVPSYSVMQSAADEAAVRTIIEDAYATTTTAAAKHSDGIRMHRHCQPYQYQANNSWQRVNPKNPTGCQLKKKNSSDGYECTINSNNYNNNNNNTNANRSYNTEIHDCQKCRASSINPFGGLCSPKMHEVGSDNAAAATASGDNGDDRDDVGAGGDAPTYCDKANKAAVLKDFTCHTGQRKQAVKLHSHASKAAFQRDVDELKEFLDEIILLTP